MTEKKKIGPPVWIHEQRAPSKIVYSKMRQTPDGMTVESQHLEIQGNSLSAVEKVFDKKKEMLK